MAEKIKIKSIKLHNIQVIDTSDIRKPPDSHSLIPFYESLISHKEKEIKTKLTFSSTAVISIIN